MEIEPGQISSNTPVILVEPQMGENIGATARSMLNFGFKDLRIVNPRDGWPNPKAVDMAKSAKSVIDNAQIFDSLAAAMHDINKAYATTARPREMAKEVISPKQTGQYIRDNFDNKMKSALVFGGERSGLSNEDIALCDAIITIPVHHEYTSLNLAQAVSICCFSIYDYFIASGPQAPPVAQMSSYESWGHRRSLRPAGINASKEELSNMLDYLDQQLQVKNFYREANKRDKMRVNINNMFARTCLTSQEVRTMYGIIRYLAKP